MIAANGEALGLPGRPRAGLRKQASFTHQLNRKIFLIYCAAAAADFRSTSPGGTAWQVGVSVVATLAFVIFVLNAQKPKRQLPSLSRVTWLWWIYIATTPFIAYWRGVPAAHYLRILLPTLLMGESLIICLMLLRESEENARLIFRGLFYAAAVSGVVYLVRGLSMGLALYNLRYYILGPLLIVLFSFTLCRLLFEGMKAGFINVIGLAGSLLVIFLSVTRSFFVGAGVILLLILHARFRPPVWLNHQVRRRVKRNLIGVAIIFLLLAAVVLVAFPSVLQHWSQRDSSLGTNDPTALTRIAEAAGEIEAMKSDTSHLLFGSGIGADHKYDMRFLIGVTAAQGEDFGATTFNPGHIAWIYQFFTSGLLLGWILPVIFVYAIWKGNSYSAPYIARLAGIAVAAALAINTLGNMLGDRGAGLGLGLLIALSLYGEKSGASVKKPAHHAMQRQILPAHETLVPAFRRRRYTPLPASLRPPEGD